MGAKYPTCYKPLSYELTDHTVYVMEESQYWSYSVFNGRISVCSWSPTHGNVTVHFSQGLL